MSCDHELANEKTRCYGKNASYITIINICNLDWVLLVYQFFTAMCYPQKINLLLYNYLLMIIGMIHWTKISGHFSLKLKGLNQKSFKKASPPFKVDRFSHLDQWIKIDHSIWPFRPILDPNTLHQYRRGHGCESRWSPDFFSGFFFPVA